MFEDAWAFNQPVNFDTDKVTDMSGMFSGVIGLNLNRVNFDIWD